MLSATVYNMADQTLTVRIEDDLGAALDAIAANLGRGRSYVVNEALRVYVEMHRGRSRASGKACERRTRGNSPPNPRLMELLATSGANDDPLFV